MTCINFSSALTLKTLGSFFLPLCIYHCALQHSASWHGYMYQCLSIKQINRTIEIKDAFPKRAKWKKEAWTLKSGNSWGTTSLEILHENFGNCSKLLTYDMEFFPQWVGRISPNMCVLMIKCTFQNIL